MDLNEIWESWDQWSFPSSFPLHGRFYLHPKRRSAYSPLNATASRDNRGGSTGGGVMVRVRGGVGRGGVQYKGDVPRGRMKAALSSDERVSH